MLNDPKLSNEQRLEVADRYSRGGITQAALAKEYEVCSTTIGKIVQQLNAKPPSLKKPAPGTDVIAFAHRAKSVLWAQDKGVDEERKTYHKWKTRVLELESADGANYTHKQSIVQASKEFKCLEKLFREYDVSAHDPNPESHPKIQAFGKVDDKQDVECQGVEQTYRESLRWAIDAAGETLRTGKFPTVCPCNAAWFLFQQAIAAPKDFMAKVGQIESRGSDEESADKRKLRLSGERSISEIDGFLSELEAIEEERTNA